MRYSIVYSSMTGNTGLLAQTIRDALPAQDCAYFGPAAPEALSAPRLYVGFWTDKGTCDPDSAATLKALKNCEVFLFGTAGFGGDPAYFEKILSSVTALLDESVTVSGTFMCQGKMPRSVRERYEKMAAAPDPAPNLQLLMDNFDRALSHPDADDLARLRAAVQG